MADDHKKPKVATLTFDDKTLELPLLSPTAGPDVIDIRKLYAQGGVFTYDPGFTSTASCDSTITYIDGDKGELLHRGYPIDQLASKSHFLEVCYLLLYGDLPTAEQLEDFIARLLQAKAIGGLSNHREDREKGDRGTQHHLPLQGIVE